MSLLSKVDEHGSSNFIGHSVTGVSHDDIVRWLRGYVNHVNESGEYAGRTILDLPGVLQLSFSNAQRHVLVLAIRTQDQSNTFVTILGGGAYDVPASFDVLAYLLDAHRHLDWGGPLARAMADGKMAFASRLTLPLSLFTTEGWDDGSNFLLNMIDVVGDNGRSLAADVVPTVGGRYFDGGPDQDTALLAAYMGQ